MTAKQVATVALTLLILGFPFISGCGQATGGDSVYLFSSFHNEQDGLLLAYSEDLYHWKQIPGPHLKPRIGDKIMRDPFVRQGPDGTYHMVWTTGWKRPDIGYACTKDFIHWSKQRLLPVMGGKEGARNCWAPKLFYDHDNRQWQIIWSTWLDDGSFPPPELPHTSKQHRIWYATTADFINISEPKLLFDPGYSCIDAYLLPDGDKYLLFFKDERYNDSDVFTPEHQNIRMAIGKSRYGPFSGITEPITGKGPGKWHNEGPSALKVNGWYYVFYDHHSGKEYFGAVRSKDLKHWQDVSKQMHFPKGFKHGHIIRVPRRIVTNLLTRSEPSRQAK